MACKLLCSVNGMNIKDTSRSLFVSMGCTKIIEISKSYCLYYDAVTEEKQFFYRKGNILSYGLIVPMRQGIPMNYNVDSFTILHRNINKREIEFCFSLEHHGFSEMLLIDLLFNDSTNYKYYDYPRIDNVFDSSWIINNFSIPIIEDSMCLIFRRDTFYRLADDDSINLAIGLLTLWDSYFVNNYNDCNASFDPPWPNFHINTTRRH